MQAGGMRKEHGVALVQQDDWELITRCRQGDLEAFGQIYARYARPVYRYAYHMLGDPDDADDLKQDAFVKAQRTLAGFRGDCSLQTWLLKIVGNLCRDRLKSRLRRGEVAWKPEMENDLRDARDGGGDPAALVERKDLHATVYGVLIGLPPAQRELIVLRDIEGLSYQQIADVLGCSVASVKLRLFRARRGFKERALSRLQLR